LKFIAFGDVHISDSMPFHSPGNNRLAEINMALAKVVDYASTEKIKHIFVAGDTFDSFKVSPSEFQVFTRFVENLWLANLEANFINGNHEIDEGGNSLFNHLIRYPNIVSYPSIRRLAIDDADFTMINYAHSTTEFIDQLEAFTNNPGVNDKQILIAHQPVQGRWFKLTKSRSGLPKDLFKRKGIIGKNFDFSIFGDFHKHQWLPYKKGIYTGSLTQNDFRDEGGPTLFHVFDTDDLPNFESIDVQAPTFHIIHVSEGTRIDFKAVKPNSYIRVVVTGTRAFLKAWDPARLLLRLEKKYAPKKINIQRFATDKILIETGGGVKRNMGDEDMVNAIIEHSREENLSERAVYEKGIYYLRRAREKMK